MTTPSPQPGDGRMTEESRKAITQNMTDCERLIDALTTATIDYLMKDVQGLEVLEHRVMNALRKRPGDIECPTSFSCHAEATVYKLAAEETVRERIEELMKDVSPLMVAMFLDIGYCEVKRRVLDLALAAGSVDILLQP